MVKQGIIQKTVQRKKLIIEEQTVQAPEVVEEVVPVVRKVQQTVEVPQIQTETASKPVTIVPTLPTLLKPIPTVMVHQIQPITGTRV